LVILLILATLTVYWPATQCDFTTYDDPFYVSENPHVQNGLTFADIQWAFADIRGANWIPLTMLSHMLDCQMYGLNPWGHHLTSVLFHLANTALVFLLLRYMTGAIWRSILVAAFFGLHPLHVESVAWVAERKDVMSTFFGLLSLVFFARYAKTQIENRKSKITNYLLCFLFLFLGLLSKPMLVTWPFVLLLLDYWPLERFKRIGVRRLVIEKIPFFALAAVFCALTLVAQKKGGAVVSLEHVPIEARLGNALVSYFRYLGKIFWPADLAVFYPYQKHWALWVVVAAAGVLIYITMIAWLVRRRYPFALIGWLWFSGTLVPVIGLVQVGAQAMADRYSYIPSIGIFILLIWGAYELCGGRKIHLMLISAAGMASLLLCCGLTRQQLGCWQNDETLMRHAIEVTENNYVAHNILGNALGKRGDIDEAIPQYQATLRINPDIPKTHYSLGMAFEKKGRLDDAIKQLQAAIRLKPDYIEAQDCLGNVYEDKGDLDGAIREYRAAISLEPDDPYAHYGLGVASDDQARLDEAISQYQTAIRLKPEYAEAHYNLGIDLCRKKQFDDAISQFQDAIRLKPDYADAYNNLGIALVSKKQIDEAIRQFREAIRFNPKDTDFRDNFNSALRIKNSPAGK
jgi:tetratricopeptide (TPR) repeat protein